MHGPGKGSTDKHPVFSNEPGSECSALGRFLVTKEHGVTLRRSFRLKGMDMDNQTAYVRGLMIHSSGWVNNHCWMRYIPLHRSSCQGCVTVSSKGMRYLWRLVNNEEKPLLLWSYTWNKNKRLTIWNISIWFLQRYDSTSPLAPIWPDIIILTACVVRQRKSPCLATWWCGKSDVWRLM